MEKKKAADEGFDYNARVKEKLIAWRDAFEQGNGVKLNYSAIAQKMEKDFHIRTSPQKISAMFDNQSPREVKLQEVAALCQMYDIPMQDICAFPNASATGIEPSGVYGQNSAKHMAVKNLDNPFYEGTYFCYYFKPKHFQNKLKPVEETEIDEAVMTISIQNGYTTVTLEEMQTRKTFFGDRTLPPFTLTGRLYHFVNTNMSYSFISDPAGRRAMALMFTFLNLSADIRYYMTAGMMTFSFNQTHAPLFQKMALFRVRQDIHNDAEKADVIRGILALNSCPVILDEETLDQLTNADADMKKLLSVEKAMNKCYVFSEASIQSNSFFIRDEAEKMRKILLIRKNSLYPAHEIVSEPDVFADFVKEYQQKQLSAANLRADQQVL